MLGKVEAAEAIIMFQIETELSKLKWKDKEELKKRLRRNLKK